MVKKLLEEGKRAATWRPDKRLVALAAVCGLVLLSLPLLRISIYTAPWNDDYRYAIFARNFLEQERSFGSALQGAIYCVKSSWYAWQGTFSSIFFMAMAPIIWGDEYYFLGPLFLMLFLPISVMILIKSLTGILKADRASSVSLQAGIAATAVVLIYSAHGGFFWYNGGIHYVGMHSFLLLLAAAWIKLIRGSRKWSSFLLMLWTLAGALLAGGSNYVTALQGLLTGLSIAALCVILQKKRGWLLAPSLLVYAFGFYMNVSAPGNQVRSNIFRDSGLGMPALEAVGNSFLEAFRHLGEFTGLATLAMMILLFPVIRHIVKSAGHFRFRYPGLLLVWSFCLYATGFTPSLYAMGHAGLGRTLNVVKLTYQILLFVNEIYWTGWLCQKQFPKVKFWEKLWTDTGAAASFYLGMAIVMVGLFFIEPNQAATYSTFCAYYYVHSGEAANFHQEYLARVEAIKTGGDVVVVEPYYFRPAPLSPSDLGEDPAYESNESIAKWYGKQAVICKKREE